MAQIRKYAFDTEFTPDGAVLSHAPKKFSADEVEAESKLAYARGSQDAIAQAERHAATALQALATAVNALLSQLNSERNAMRAEAVQIALAAARAVSGAALDEFGAERAAQAVEAAMDTLRHQPRLIVKLPQAQAETLSPRIAEMTQTHGYEGAVLVRADPKLKNGEVVIDWSDGVISIDPAEITQRIEGLIAAALAAPDQTS